MGASIAGAAIGAGASLLGGGKKSMKVQQSNLMPWQEEYVKQGMSGAQQAYQNPEEALGYSTATGSYLNKNPYMDEAVQRAQQSTIQNYEQSQLPSLFARYAKSGMLKSGAFGQALGSSEQRLQQNLADTASKMYGANYARERALQEAAMQRFDPLARSQQYLSTVGGTGYGSQLPVQERNKWMDAIGGGLAGIQMFGGGFGGAK